MSKALHCRWQTILNTTALLAARAHAQPPLARSLSYSAALQSGEGLDDAGIAELLSKPAWSTKSLLPSQTSSEQLDASEKVTPKQLHRLLRLSALPAPASPEQEVKMLEELHSQLHFVRNVQSADTRGVEPLLRISDESQDAQTRNEVSLASMKAELDADAASKSRGRLAKRKPAKAEAEEWDPLAQAPKRFGRFFVVDEADG